MNKESRTESSVPVQARVSIVTLAELVNFWEHHGYHVRSMSQLVAWSLDWMTGKLGEVGELPVKIESVSDAHRHLEGRGLYQGSLKERAFMKVGTAIRFENMRKEGIDPESYAPTQYKMLHNKQSVEAAPIREEMSDEELMEIARVKWEEGKLKKQREEYERRKEIRAAIEEAREKGKVVKEKEKANVWEGMTEEEFWQKAKEREVRDAEYMKRLNAQVDPNFGQTGVEKSD